MNTVWGPSIGGDNFRIHSPHRHTVLPNNTIRLETDTGNLGYKWANATPIKHVDPAKVHPTFFKLHEGGWVAFEFAEGPLPIAVKVIPEALLSKIAAYIAENELNNMLALELGDFAACRAKMVLATAEIEVQWSDGSEPLTLCVSVKDLVDAGGNERRLVPTGWYVPSAPRYSSLSIPHIAS